MLLDFILDIVLLHCNGEHISERMRGQFQLYFPMCPFPQRNFQFYLQYPV